MWGRTRRGTGKMLCHGVNLSCNVPHRLLYFILNMAFVIPVKNLGSFITTTFITQTSSAYNLHPHQRAAQYYYQGTLNHGKEPHRQHQCRKNPCYVCKGENSARPTSFFLQKAGTPFQYHCTKEGAFLLHHNYSAGASLCHTLAGCGDVHAVTQAKCCATGQSLSRTSPTGFTTPVQTY